MVVYALIPARSGSKGVPDKNIRDIEGHPLLAYAVAFGRALNIDRVILSTDSEKYAELGKRYGAECPYLRGPKASSDTAMEEDILADLAENLPRYNIAMPDIWVRLKPTSPFRKVETVRKAIALLEGSPDIDSVRIVSETEARIWTINKEGWFEPMAPNWDPKRSVMRRSEFPPAFKPFNLDILRHQNWIERGSAYMGKKIYPIKEHKITGIDVDDHDDLELVKAMIESRPRSAIVDAYIVTPTFK